MATAIVLRSASRPGRTVVKSYIVRYASPFAFCVVASLVFLDNESAAVFSLPGRYVIWKWYWAISSTQPAYRILSSRLVLKYFNTSWSEIIRKGSSDCRPISSARQYYSARITANSSLSWMW